MAITVFLSVLGLIFMLSCVLLAYSPGKIEPYVDDAGKTLIESISEKTFLNIGGVKQGMFIRSKNINNPVLVCSWWTRFSKLFFN